MTDDSIIKKHFPELLKDRLSIENMCEYMFHICLGGNDWGSSLIWQLLNCNVVFIPYPFDFESIFTIGLIPYKHFIPVSHDLNDLDEKIQIMTENENEKYYFLKNTELEIVLNKTDNTEVEYKGERWCIKDILLKPENSGIFEEHAFTTKKIQIFVLKLDNLNNPKKNNYLFISAPIQNEDNISVLKDPFYSQYVSYDISKIVAE